MSICSVAQYRLVTRDYTSYDGDVLSALADAQSLLEEETERLFTSATRTETLAVTNGRVWPAAVPITSVSAGGTVDVDRCSVLVSAYDSVEEPYPSSLLPTATVTYVGGFASAPPSLVRLVAEMASLALFPASLSGVPAGANSVSLAGQSYSSPGFLGGASSLPPGIRSHIREWKHPKSRLP